MKRIAAFLLAFGLMTLALRAQPIPTAPQTLRTVITATETGTITKVETPRQVIADVQYRGYRSPAGGNGQGRCVALLGAPFTQIRNVEFISGDDDALSITGDSHGTIVCGVDFTVADWRESKALCAYTNPNHSNQPGPVYTAADGYAAQFIGCKLQGSGSAARMVGGVWQFIDCDIYVSALAGLDVMDVRLNLIECRFHTIPKPDAWGWWYRDIGPCPIRVTALRDGKQSATNLKSSIFTRGCTLDGKPVATADLLRRYNATLGYDGPGSVPAACVRKTPN